MNFTKDYISLCKNDKVQGLRKKLEVGDWIFSHKMEKAVDHEEAKGLFIVMDYRKDMAMYWLGMDIIESDCDEDTLYGESRTWDYRNDLIWLPTGDQLDQCIVDICKKKFNGYFQYEMCFITTEWYGTIRYWEKSKEYMKDDELLSYAIKIDENPLIAKIKLLISILEE